MPTPESKVKARVKAILGKYGGYMFMPVTGGYGKSGVPDIVGCLGGKFIAIECKANGGIPTALQLKNLRAIAAAGGHAFVIDETSIGVFILIMDQVLDGTSKPQVYDLSDYSIKNSTKQDEPRKGEANPAADADVLRDVDGRPDA